MPSDIYGLLADHYDDLLEFRRPLGAARKKVIGPILPGVRSVCDLCCGTGDLAIEFALKGMRTFAVDLSPSMCRAVRRKAKLAGAPVAVLCADMRSFRLPDSVDLVTCEFDALNHVPSKRDLGRVLKAVAKALNPGGYFSFDLNNRLAFEKIWTTTWFIDRDPVAAVMQGSHKPGTDRAAIDLNWFERRGNAWKRSQERVEEVCWSASEVRAALAAAGFHQVRAWDGAPLLDDPFTQPGYRTFWRARKRSD